MKIAKNTLAVAMIASILVTGGCSNTTTSEVTDKDATTSEVTTLAETEAETAKTAEASVPDGCVTDGNGWYLWDENGKLTIEGRDAKGTQAVVSSGEYEASRAGIEILKAGGNAIDAAVAISFAIGVAEPNASGIGGGGFMLIRSEDGTSAFVNFREKAPANASPAMWVLDSEGHVQGNEKAVGGKSVGVPGTVRGMEYAFNEFGSGNVTWKQVLEPAIRLAEAGITVTPSLYDAMFGAYDLMTQYPELGEIYLDDMGFPYEAGNTLSNEDLAKTLQLIAEEGASVFYEGEIAEAIVESVKAHNGLITKEDLSSYQVEVLEASSGTYRGYQILSSPLPSSGGAHVIEALNILENFDMSENTDEALRTHRMTEAFKMCFRDRSEFMGDPAYMKVPIEGILSKERAKVLADSIDDQKADNFEMVDPWIYEHEDTTHFSVADAKGNIVSVTQTINGAFGSKVVADGYGFVLNNELNDFSADPDSPNAVAGGKTPLSSMSPTIVLKEDGSPFMVLGSPGSTKIITAVTEVIVNVIDRGMSLQEAINAPRFYSDTSGNVQCESRLSEHVRKYLQNAGNELSISSEYDKSQGAVNAVLYGEDGLLYGGADPRRDGKALGH